MNLKMLGEVGLHYILKNYTFDSVLDVGSGEGVHSDLFLENDKKVFAVDMGNSPYFESRKSGFGDIEFVVGDFNTYDFGDAQYDCVWASHILEHQRNVGMFLEKIVSLTNDDGVICITVPPMKTNIVGGHVTLWNGGLLLYNLVLCGLDCSDATILTYGYNISIIVNKKTFDLPENLSYDMGDIEKLSKWLPSGYDYQGFDGNILKL